MVEMPAEITMKLILVGDSPVGKSSLLLRYADDIFTEAYLATIGVDFKIKKIQIGEQKIKLQIWDTAGQERFKSITSAYYKGANGIAIVYEVDEKDTFNSVKIHFDEISKLANENVAMMIIGSKIDLPRQVTYDEGHSLADSLGAEFAETSSKTGENVEAAFTKFAEVSLKKMKL